MSYSRSIFCTLLLLTSLLNFSQPSPSYAHKSVAITSGYYRGFGVNTQFMFHNFLPDAKGHLRIGLGYTILDPGNANDARKIFSSDATDGSAAKSGRSLDFRVDYLLAKKFLNLDDSYIAFGPRYATFKGTFNFNGQEKFNVTSRQLGIGIGAENYFNIDRNFDFVVITGVDYYFSSTLFGPKTFYRPSDDNINARINQDTNIPYTYKDANKAINQPQLIPRILIGIAYYL